MTTGVKAEGARVVEAFAPSPAPSTDHFVDYAKRLSDLMAGFDWTPVTALADELLDCWRTGRRVFLAGNGGSAANAVHLANDFLYSVSKEAGSGLRVDALPANSSILTCLANDEGYDEVFSLQLAVKGQPGDILIVLSSSGNSPNIVRALEEARRIGMRSYAVLGSSGGKALGLADVPIHCPIDDTQISEDMQLVMGHMVLQWLYKQRDSFAG